MFIINFIKIKCIKIKLISFNIHIFINMEIDKDYRNKDYICNIFERLITFKMKESKVSKDSAMKWKIKSLKDTLNILKSLEKSTLYIEDIKNVKGIGKGALTRIEEIITKGFLDELEKYENTDTSEIDKYSENITKLESISGIGTSKANKLLEKGITFELLYKEKNDYDTNNFKNNQYLKELTKHQFICLKYYDDILERIPRKEIDTFNHILSNIFGNIDIDLVYEICGSYRRGNQDSGDIDILFCHKECYDNNDLENSEKYLKLLLKSLKKEGIIVENLTISGDLKYMGICKIPGFDKNRRLDIKYVPYNSYIPGLLHFTGSYQENIRLRKIGKEKNYKINEYGIYKIEDKKEIQLVLNNEKELYDILEEDYKSPLERN